MLEPRSFVWCSLKPLVVLTSVGCGLVVFGSQIWSLPFCACSTFLGTYMVVCFDLGFLLCWGCWRSSFGTGCFFCSGSWHFAGTCGIDFTSSSLALSLSSESDETLSSFMNVVKSLVLSILKLIPSLLQLGIPLYVCCHGCPRMTGDVSFPGFKHKTYDER